MMDITNPSILTLSESIRIDKIFTSNCISKDACPLPFALWFRHGTNCKFIRLTQLENFPAYIRVQSENISGSNWEELQQSPFVKRGMMDITKPSILTFS